jgi:hypothetical protein
MARGGAREGAGRKPKADELKLLEKLSPMDDLAFEKLSEGVHSGDIQFLKMFFEYRFGKPKQTIDATVEGELSILWAEEKTYEADEKANQSD